MTFFFDFMNVMKITHVGRLVITNDFSCFETKLEMLKDRMSILHVTFLIANYQQAKISS